MRQILALLPTGHTPEKRPSSDGPTSSHIRTSHRLCIFVHAVRLHLTPHIHCNSCMPKSCLVCEVLSQINCNGGVYCRGCRQCTLRRVVLRVMCGSLSTSAVPYTRISLVSIRFGCDICWSGQGVLTRAVVVRHSPQRVLEGTWRQSGQSC